MANESSQFGAGTLVVGVLAVLTMRPKRYFSLTERDIRRLVSSQDMVGKNLEMERRSRGR